MSEYSEHRKVLHDVFNQLAIAEGSARRALKIIPSELKSNEVQENLEMTVKYIQTSINKLKEYRVFIHSLEGKNKHQES